MLKLANQLMISTTSVVKKAKRAANVITAVGADVGEDCHISCQDPTSVHGVYVGTMFNILLDDLGLVRKYTKWVPKLLREEQKQERVRTRWGFIAVTQPRSMSMMDNIIILDMVCYHTPETKKNSQNSGFRRGIHAPSRPMSRLVAPSRW
jgi:hypothetical protein